MQECKILCFITSFIIYHNTTFQISNIEQLSLRERDTERKCFVFVCG